MALQAAVGSSINRAKNLLPTLALPKRLPQGTREAFEAAIEAHLEAATALTRALDTVDGDPELEPSLGSRTGGDQDLWAVTQDRTDREGDEHDGRELEDEGHDLGWPEMVNQNRALTSCETSHNADMGGGQWACGNDGEPELSASEHIDQRKWCAGGRRDLEEQCEDEGAQCEDEGADEHCLGGGNA